MQDETTSLEATGLPPATDTPPADAPAPARVAVTLGGKRFELDSTVADEVTRVFSEQAGRLGSRLDQLSRQNEMLQAQLQQSMTAPASTPALGSEDDEPLELPPVPVPDRDLWSTAPDAAAKQMADAIAERERRMLAHTASREARLREEHEALTLAAVRELAREREVERQQAQTVLVQQEESQRRWESFYEANADLSPYKKTVSRLFRELKGVLPASTPVEVALDRLAQEARDEIRAIRGDMPTTTPRTVSAGAPRVAAAVPKPEPPKTLSDMILEKQARLRTLGIVPTKRTA